MNKTLFQPLDAAGIQAIHDKAIHVLEQTGFHLSDPVLASLLKDRGVEAAQDGKIFRVPKAVVEDILAMPVRPVVLTGRNGDVLPLKAGLHHHFSGADILKLRESNGTVRPTTQSDLVAFTRMADALPEIKGMCAQVYAGDASREEAEIVTYQTLLQNTQKHCLAAPLTGDTAKTWVDLGRDLAGTRDLAGSSIISMVVSTTSPLQFDDNSAQAFRAGVEAGVPVIILPQPICGASAPFTLAGTLVINHAENLFALVVARLLRADAPFVYGGAPTIMQMKLGNVNFGCPEYALLCSSVAQLAEHCGLPSYSSLPQTASFGLDFQNGAEKMAYFLAAVTSGLNVTLGAGALANATIASKEQLAMDHELLRWAQRVQQGIEVTEATLAGRTIHEAGPSGSFMACDHTLEYLRSGEHFESDLFYRPGMMEEEAGFLMTAQKKMAMPMNKTEMQPAPS